MRDTNPAWRDPKTGVWNVLRFQDVAAITCTPGISLHKVFPEVCAEAGGSKMPAPRSIARFNKRFTNKLTSKVAGYLPGFAIVSHVGRKSGRAYRTPVNAFRTDDGYIIALTYGAQSDWVKNVMAAGSCELQSRGRRVRLISPRIETDKSKSWAPLPVRLILSLIDASQYMRFSLERASIGSTRNTTALYTEVHDTLYPRGAKEVADDKYTTDSESDQRRRRSR